MHKARETDTGGWGYSIPSAPIAANAMDVYVLAADYEAVIAEYFLEEVPLRRRNVTRRIESSRSLNRIFSMSSEIELVTSTPHEKASRVGLGDLARMVPTIARPFTPAFVVRCRCS